VPLPYRSILSVSQSGVIKFALCLPLRVLLYGYAVVSVKVNTTDCDSVNMGSIPILLPKDNCLVNSAVECLPYKEKVGGSIPSQGTKIFPDS